MYLTFARHNRAFQSVGVWQAGTASITGVAQPEQVDTALITDGILQTFNVPPVAGQWLTAADQDPHANGRVMLSYGYWQRRFGGDPNVVGRVISVDSQPRQVAGVMPRGFKILNYNFDLLVPLAFDPVNQSLAGFGYRGIARLRPDMTISQANADAARLLNVWMDSWTNGPGIRSAFLPQLEDHARIPAHERCSGRQRRQRAVGGDGNDRRRHADRVHECSKSSAGSRRCTQAGVAGTRCPRRGQMAGCARAPA